MTDVTVKQDPDKPVTTEILAQAIVDIAAAMKRIDQGRLTRRALTVLLKDQTGVPMGTIDAIFNALASLERTYLKPKPAPKSQAKKRKQA